LYSTDVGKSTDPDDLEFTLAVADTVAVALENLSRQQELAENLNQIRDENVELRERLGVQSEIVGASEAMNQVAREIARAAPSRATVLIRGESGVGKELVARAVHFSSPRRKAPFGCINCAALSETLLESELFGHEKGAFTGAHQERKGLIESASGGTLFLDEIGDIPAPIQVKLLRFLQEQTFIPVGGRKEKKADARIVAATNADLKQSISKGKFREDLYFRLAVVTIHLPPLREREDDVEVLARAFLERFAAQNDRPGLSFASDAIRALNKHGWPGNVRELQNRVQRAAIMADGKRILATDLELDGSAGVPSSATLKEARESVERELVQRALKRHGGKISPAAAELGISRPTMYELMDKLGIARE